jgi:hypothetical protein
MHRAQSCVFALVVFLGLPALAASPATVESVKGRVLINHGDGFVPTGNGAEAKPGDLLMASSGGSAKLVYPGGCQVKVIPGHVVSVGKQPPCKAAWSAGLEEVPPERSFFTDPILPFAVTAGVGWGIFCAATYCRDHGGGGRPASP